MVGAGIVLAMPGRIAAVVNAVVRSPAWSAPILRFVDELRVGLAAAATPGRLAAVLAWSLATWTVNALCLYVLLPGFGIELGLAATLIMQAVIVFGIAVPSSPGFVGVYHAAIVAVLSLHHVPGDQAMAYAITSHVIAFAPITLLGLWSATRVAGTWGNYRSLSGNPVGSQALPTGADPL
jgi:hypothetical protein